MPNGQHPYHYQSQIDIAIYEAQKAVAEKGVEGADSKDVILAGFGWLAGRLNGNGRSKREVIIKVGTPAALGGGTVAIVLTIIQRLLGA